MSGGFYISLLIFAIICLCVGVFMTIRDIRRTNEKRKIITNTVLCVLWIMMIIYDFVMLIIAIIGCIT